MPENPPYATSEMALALCMALTYLKHATGGLRLTPGDVMTDDPPERKAAYNLYTLILALQGTVELWIEAVEAAGRPDLAELAREMLRKPGEPPPLPS